MRLSVLLLVLALSSCSQPAIPFRLRVLCLDLAREGDLGASDRDLDAWARTVRHAVPDIVTLQGVPEFPSDAGSAASALARRTGLHGAMAAPASPGGVETGPGILSRWPLDDRATRRWGDPTSPSGVAISVDLNGSMPTLPESGASRGLVMQTTVPLKFLALRMQAPVETARAPGALEEIVPRRGRQLTVLTGIGAGSGLARFLGRNWTEAVHVSVRSPRSSAGRVFCFPRTRWKVIHAAPLDDDELERNRTLLVVLELVD